MPAPAGEHELVDGTKITLDDAGIITAVTVASEPVVEPAPAEPSEAELKIAQLEAELASLKSAHAGFESKMAESNAKFAAMRSALN
jgi:multidrug resistance efflux pump